MDQKRLWVVSLIKAAAHPVGADTESEEFLWVIIGVMFCKVFVIKLFLVPGFPSTQIINDGGRHVWVGLLLKHSKKSGCIDVHRLGKFEPLPYNSLACGCYSQTISTHLWLYQWHCVFF